MADYISSLINLGFLIFGASLGFVIDIFLYRWKDKEQNIEKKNKYITSILFELDTNAEILHPTYNKNLGILPTKEVITGLISTGDLILFDKATIDEIMMYKKELEITSNNIRDPLIIIRKEFGDSDFYRAIQKLKGKFLDLKKMNETQPATKE